MKYDPVKDKIMHLIQKMPFMRKMFFYALDMLFLRQWYVKKHVLSLFRNKSAIDFFDAGAGFCQYSDFVLNTWQDSKVHAADLKTDYMTQYASYAEHVYPERFSWKQADLVQYKPEIRFDLILAIDILEHIEDDRQVLSNFFDCLKSGGILIISTPSDKDEAARFTEEHVRPGYDKSDLSDKLTNAGFSIKNFQFSYGIFGKLSWKLSIYYPLKLVSISKYMLLLLPIYYIALYLPIYILMQLDINTYNKSGNGIIVVAEKPINAF